jgi:transposase InsO family protein
MTIRSEPKAWLAIGASDGFGGDLSEASDHAEFKGASEISVSTARSGCRSAEQGVGLGHHNVPLARGFMYLVAIIDWHSRGVLCWRLSNSLEGSFCLEALDEALSLADQKFSTRIRECSSRVQPSQSDWKEQGCRSAWTRNGVRWTMCL